MTDLVFQPFFINGAQLFEKNDGIPDNVVSRCVDLDVRRQFGFIHLGSNGSTDHCRAVFVPDIVLDDEYSSSAVIVLPWSVPSNVTSVPRTASGMSDTSTMN